MQMKRRHQSSRIRKKARRGFRGYPVATIALYGPTAEKATKVAVGIINGENQEPAALERWFSDEVDVRFNPEIDEQILAFIKSKDVKSVVMTDRIIGCPHEEGTDYPDGASCPQCPYWAGRDRWTHDRIH